MLVEPLPDVVVEELLAPEHAGQRLTHDQRGVARHARRRDGCVERIRLLASRLQDGVEVSEWPAGHGGRVDGRQADLDLDALAGGHGDPVVGGGLGAGLGRVHRTTLAVNDVVVDPVLDPRALVRLSGDPLGVGLVLGEEQGRVLIAVEVPLTQLGVGCSDHADAARTLQAPAARAWDSQLPHDHVLRNQSVGSTWSAAGSGPRLATVSRTRMSSGEALAYSTNTSK